MISTFANRREAGRELARALSALDLVDPVVLALPRGGVPVATEVAAALRAPLDLLLVRKIGALSQPELAVAAVAEGPGDGLVLDLETMERTDSTRAYVEREAVRQRAEIARRRAAYLGGRARLPIEGRTVVVVDDGIATGTTMRAALQSLRGRHPGRLVLAVPVAPPGKLLELRPLVDDLVCLLQPPAFYAVGAHYLDFRQVCDDEVITALESAGLETEGGVCLDRRGGVPANATGLRE